MKPAITITVRHCPVTDRHELYVHDGRMSPMPAGPRLFRAPPLPDIQFSHGEFAAAAMDAEKLAKYLAEVAPRSSAKKAAKNQWD